MRVNNVLKKTIKFGQTTEERGNTEERHIEKKNKDLVEEMSLRKKWDLGQIWLENFNNYIKELRLPPGNSGDSKHFDH